MPRKQLLSIDEASTTKRQHKTPCSDCPWRRTAMKGWLGGLDAADWIDLAQSDYPIHCHTKIDPDGEPHQCAGSSIFRSNICKEHRNGTIELPADRGKVFANALEFLSHHLGRKVEWAEAAEMVMKRRKRLALERELAKPPSEYRSSKQHQMELDARALIASLEEEDEDE